MQDPNGFDPWRWWRSLEPQQRLLAGAVQLVIGLAMTFFGFRLFRAEVLRDPAIDIGQTWLDSYDLEPYVLYKAIRRGYRVIEVPCTVRYHAREGYTKMRGLRDWWRLFRPALLLRTGVKR